MKIKINYNELNNISNTIVTKSEDISKILDDIFVTIESVDKVWEGKDCKEFIEEAKKNIEDEKSKNEVLHNFGNSLSTISNDYNIIENEWAEEVKRESLG